MKTNKHHISILTCVLLFLVYSCTNKQEAKLSNEEIMHQNQEQLTKLIIYDVFNPPVASRIYVYTSLAAYEAVRFDDSSKYESLTAKLHGFKSFPRPEKNKTYNFTLAATKAFFTVTRKVTFSVDSLKRYEDRVYNQFKEELDEETFNRSFAFGEKVAASIMERAADDNYAKTRGAPKYIGSQDTGKWRPTPPDYFDGVEYTWGKIKTLAIDSSSHFLAPTPPPYRFDTGSVFYKANLEVYRIDKDLTPEQKEIARYWDDNPFVMEHSGHMMFANKKITPGGHWVGITRIACEKTKADKVKTAQAYSLTAVALFDGFISCWDEKYRSNIIRPVSFINDNLDPNWMPFLQTPPFPEYPSGHSTITRAAATVLTRLFGDNFSFLDTSDLEYIGMKRNFQSFIQAADEASISRVYGGIHYLHSVSAGSDLGRRIGEHVIAKLKL